MKEFDGFFILDYKGLFVDSNEAFCALLGYSREELLKTKVYDLVHSEALEDIKQHLNQIETLGSQRFETHLLSKAGKIIDIELYASFLDNNEGKRIFVFCQEIDEKKLQDKETLSILQTMLDSISDGVLVVSREGNIITYNHKFLELWDIPEALIESGNDNKLLMFVQNQLKRPDEFLALVNLVYANPEKYVNDILEFKDGKFFERYSQPQKVENKIVGRIWCFRDVTERKKFTIQLENINNELQEEIAEHKKAETALKESEERFRATFEQAAVGIVHATIEGKFLRVNQKFCNIIGYTQDELSNMTFMEITHPDDLQNDMNNMLKLHNNDINTFSMEKRYFKKDGSIVWTNITISLINQPLKKHKYVMGVVEDITERKHAEEAVKESEYTLRALFEGSSDAILIIEDNKVINCNKAALELFEYASEDSIHGKSLWELSPEKQPDGKLSKDKILDIYKITQKNGKSIFEWWNQKSDNTLLIVEIMLTSILLNGRSVYHALCRDIGDRKQMEQKLEYLSYHDQLTGLYNRRFYEEELMRSDVEKNLPLSIVIGDVNGLKLINDSFGHAMGDELLKKVAEVIKKGCRADDIVARLGGDEFVIILPKTDIFDAEKIIKRIRELTLKEKLGFIDISISFGYDTKNNKDENIQEVFKNAEGYMYKKKLLDSPSMRGNTVNAIISTLNGKNKREEQHSLRVSMLCKNMGEALNLPERDIEELETVGLLHDIGKIAVETNILNKQEELTDDEWKEIKRHPEIGYRILSTVNEMSEMADYVLAHHERWDGNGYPKGLKGKEIPFQSRIIAIADAYDAITSERCYRSALPKKVALEELHKNAGIQFDPELVSVFIEKVIG